MEASDVVHLARVWKELSKDRGTGGMLDERVKGSEGWIWESKGVHNKAENQAPKHTMTCIAKISDIVFGGGCPTRC